MKKHLFAKYCLLFMLVFALCISLASCVFFIEGGQSNAGENKGDGENGGENGGGNEGNNGGENADGGEQTPPVSHFEGCVSAPADSSANLPPYYTVLVVDGEGAPLNNLIVTLKGEDAKTVSEMPTGVPATSGRADFMALTSGKYRISVTDPAGTKYEYSDNLLIDETNKNVTVSLYNPRGKQVNVYGQIEDSKAYTIGEGIFLTDATESGKKQYFIIYASSSGVFEVCVNSADALVEINGDPNYVLAYDTTGEEYRLASNRVRFEIPPIKEGGEVTPIVVSVASADGAALTLSVERYGNLPPRPEYQEWNIITARGSLQPYSLPQGAALTDIDITDMTLSVTLGEDGYYYTSDGKLVVLRLGTASAYLDPIALIAGHMDENVGTTFGGYIYDEDGNYVRKDNFNSLIGTYYENSDAANGVYPLTEELANAIMVHGNHNGWFESDGLMYLFGEVTAPVNSEISWLFACCTVEE